MDFVQLLRQEKLRATPHRIALLTALAKAGKPLTAEELHGKGTADLVTVYRTLQSLLKARLVREVRFKDASVRYEFVHGEHHHHLVCTSCGVVDELPECDVRSLETKALAASSMFASVDEHALEFFGTCVGCAKR